MELAAGALCRFDEVTDQHLMAAPPAEQKQL